jgi:3',5'-cyclic AMP phosphodiesterase CpdA
MTNDRVRIVCVSDTHNDNLTDKVPDGDILLHAGDMTDDGTYDELEKALSWIRKLPHKLKLIIPGMKIVVLLSEDGATSTPNRYSHSLL